MTTYVRILKSHIAPHAILNSGQKCYDYVKGKFTAWTKLKNKTGNLYDPSTNTFNLTEDEWQTEMKSNKYVEALRRSSLSYPELCIQLFEGSTSNGFDSWGPSSTLPHPSEEVSDYNLNGLDDIVSTQMEPATQGVSEESSVRSRNKREFLTQVGEEISKVAKMLIEKHNLSNDMDACMEKLGSLGWEDFEARYQTTLLLFGESTDIKKVWLKLQTHTCELWVKNAGAK
ncbi:hypothetical protein QVD17_00803 [Tagetes erecta]|uniref:Myb/SANT-like domain-containing protein n=1 Tax=Tagetes erecta TaxID=13708 RepID=A0AAD8P0W2_TARER|nr:hypothetical protein QVD17_00803 [Tagetes erecta]